MIAVYDENQWQALCTVIGRPEWGGAERFSTTAERKAHAAELDKHIENWTAQMPAETVARMLQKKGIPAGVVQDAKDLADDPQLRTRNFFVNLEHPVLGDTISERSPVFFQKDAAKNWKPAPLLGADNRYVYMELLGFTEEKLSSYIEKGIIG